MSDFSEVFKNKLKKKAEELEYSNSSTFLDQISEELKAEIENNKVLQFKKSLLEQRKETTKLNLQIGLFDLLEQTSQEIQKEQKEIIEEVVEEPVTIFEHIDLISATIDSINKEEKIKSVKEHTDLFNQPNSIKSDPSIKVLQDKLKFLEDWVSKISMTGPGGGASDAITLSYPIKEVNSDYTMNRKDYCLLVNPSVKTYINLPPAHDERRVIIKDISGHAHLTPIHINGMIDGDINGAEIRVKYASLQLIYKNNSWWIV
jgi:hypothetical protein